jgi:hypothetical protein
VETENDDLLKKFRALIRNSARAIEAQFRESHHSWLACYENQLFVLKTYAGVLHNRGYINDEQFEFASIKLATASKKRNELNKSYTGKIQVPDEIKVDLLEQLNILP